MLAYYTRRENLHFVVVHRAWTTSETPARLSIIRFCCAIGLMSLYIDVLIAVVLTSPSYVREVCNHTKRPLF